MIIHGRLHFPEEYWDNPDCLILTISKNTDFYGCVSWEAYPGSRSKLKWEPRSPGFLSWTRLIGPLIKLWIHRQLREWQQNREGQAEWGGQEHMVPWLIQTGLSPEEQSGQLWRGNVRQTASWQGPHSRQLGIWWRGPWWVKAHPRAWQPMLASPGQEKRCWQFSPAAAWISSGQWPCYQLHY